MYETCRGFKSLQIIFLTFFNMRSVMILCPFADTPPNLLMILFAIVTTNEIKIDQNPTNEVLCPRRSNGVSESSPSSRRFLANVQAA